jgi:hypothetical protein
MTLTRQKKQEARCRAPESRVKSLTMRIRDGGMSNLSDIKLEAGDQN